MKILKIKYYLKKFFTKINLFYFNDHSYTIRKFVKTFGYIPNFKNPKTFNEKINWRKLYDHKDFIRVDLYSINNKVYFGELTNYPENGFGKFQPAYYDTIFGEYWELDKIV